MDKTRINDPWLKVLESRAAELQHKYEHHKRRLSQITEDFRAWVNEAEAVDLCYDCEFKASQVGKARETYQAVWLEFKKAEAELEEYKEVMGYEV